MIRQEVYKDNSGLWAFRVEDTLTQEVYTGVRVTKKLAQEAIIELIRIHKIL